MRALPTGDGPHFHLRTSAACVIFRVPLAVRTGVCRMRILALFLLAVAWTVIGGAALAPAAGEDKGKPKSDAPKRKPKFTIGKDTTYITGPVDKDGYIDYVAALNERLRQGVTSDNNANVLLWKAFGPKPDGVAVPAGFFKAMGIDPPPERGEYFVEALRFMKGELKLDSKEFLSKIDEELYLSRAWPWTAKEYPHIAAWVNANEKPLALAVEANRRTRYYCPLIPRG